MATLRGKHASRSVPGAEANAVSAQSRSIVMRVERNPKPQFLNTGSRRNEENLEIRASSLAVECHFQGHIMGIDR